MKDGIGGRIDKSKYAEFEEMTAKSGVRCFIPWGSWLEANNWPKTAIRHWVKLSTKKLGNLSII
jgi:hypothetical protein